MLTLNNRILKSSMALLLTLALILSGLFYSPIQSYGLTKEVTVHHIRLDTAVVFVWSDGKSGWQKGIAPNESFNTEFLINIGTKMKNVAVHKYDGSNFPFDWSKDTDTYKQHWNPTKACRNASDYNTNYMPFSARVNSVGDNTSYSSSTGIMYLKYNVILSARDGSAYDVKKKLNVGDKQGILDLLGDNPPADLTKAMNLFSQESAKIDPSIQGYLYFVPIITEYDETVIMDLGELSADVVAPSTAKQGETFTVSDESILSDSLLVDNAVLRKSYDNGQTWEAVTTWNGTVPGQNTGGSISQSEPNICTIIYELTVTTTNGLVDKDTATVNITDSRQVDGQAILELPKYTYEGHPAEASDVSEFKVDGISYSARRAYEEGVASNRFVPLPSGSGNAKKTTKTTADVVFLQRGFYNVRLDVNTVSGQTLTDTKPIEVRKTPYIIDRLGGFQKQNRKQLLNISVATYPDKPIVDYYIELKDMKTGETINLTKANPQDNNATIKTRTHTTSGDQYWTNFTLEFLTKTPTYDASNPDGSQDFRYTVYVKDSKGDTDTAQKIFKVVPDLPPNPNIMMQDSFIRNKGTNIAEIITEDGSTTDGDQLERTWSVEGRNLKELDGYKDLSFSSGQKVKYNKQGVGKANIKLDVKDIWKEPTLEEYITPSDYLTASTSKITDVLNIAPVVRLEPIKSEKVDIMILTDKDSKSEYETKLNSLKASLLEGGIDGNSQVITTAKPNSHGYRKVGQWEWPVSINCPCCSTSSRLLYDSEYTYKVESVGRTVSGYQDVCTAPHTVYALKSGEPLTNTEQSIAWSYTVTESNNFSLKLDSNEKYIYILCKDINKTILLNRNTGAYVTTLNILLPDSNAYVTSMNDNIYFLLGDKIQKYDVDSASLQTVVKKGGSLGRLQNGKITFVGSELNNRFYIGQFDMATETLTAKVLPKLPEYTWTGGDRTAISPTDLDTEGKVTFTQIFKDDYPDNVRYAYWVADSKSGQSKMFSGNASDLRNISVGFVKDEKGIGKYVYMEKGDDGSSGSTTRRYHTIIIYELDKNGMPSVGHTIYDSKDQKANWNGISYAKLHSQENKIYLMMGSDYGWNGLIVGIMLRISLPSWSVENTKFNWGWDDAEEYGSWNDSLMGTFLSMDRWTGMSQRAKLFRNSITTEQAIYSSVIQKSNFRQDAKNYIVLSPNVESEVLKDISNPIYVDTEYNALRSILLQNNANIICLASANDLDKVAELIKGEKEKPVNALEFDNTGALTTTAGIRHNALLEPNTEYGYEYDVMVSGTAINSLFKPITRNLSLLPNETACYKEEGAKLDFSNPASVANNTFYTSGISQYYSDPRRAGLFTGDDGKKSRSDSYNCWVEFTMQNAGYVGFEFYNYDNYNNSTYSIGVDGITVESGTTNVDTYKTVFLDKGKHKLVFSGYQGSYIGINNIQTTYLSDKDNELFSQEVIPTMKPDENGNLAWQKITNRFKTPKIAYLKLSEKKDGLKQEKFENMTYIENLNDYIWITPDKYVTFYTRNDETLWGFNTVNGTAHMGSGYYSVGIGYFQVTAPIDKHLIVSYDEQVTAPRNTPVTSGGGRFIDKKTIVVPSGNIFKRDYNVDYRYRGSVNISNVKVIEVPTTIDANTIVSLAGASDVNMSKNFYTMNFIEGDNSSYMWNTHRVDNDAPNQSISLEFTEKASIYIKNFKFYKITNGVKHYLISEVFNDITGIVNNGWEFISNLDNVKISPIKSKVNEDVPLVYKKGELVAYNIFYDDYENDPSKKQYWKYTHTPMNDGPSPHASVILDEDGNVVSSGGAILNVSVPRFYVDGKYTVEHWQEDNTTRGVNPNGNPDYDKTSNVESITFYIEGGGSAPWVTGISTSPSKVTENNYFSINIGVDDAEKDVLRLTTEVYKDKKLIFTHKQSNIVADANGVYPVTNTGALPNTAQGGRYDVVCTVRDWSGAGLGTYKFIVISEGKITGCVNHTDQWDANRKQYNLKQFDNEVNYEIFLNEYLKLTIPRKRGINVFWSGEKFIIQASVAGMPNLVTSQIIGYPSYKTTMTSTGKKNAENETIYTGELWDKTMINKWGTKAPEPLTFRFTANYSGGVIKTHDVTVIVDSKQDYWQLHRLW